MQWEFLVFLLFRLLFAQGCRLVFPLKPSQNLQSFQITTFEILSRFYHIRLVSLSTCTSSMIWWFNLFAIAMPLKKVLMCFIAENDCSCVGCSHYQKEFC